MRISRPNPPTSLCGKAFFSTNSRENLDYLVGICFLLIAVENVLWDFDVDPTPRQNPLLRSELGQTRLQASSGGKGWPVIVKPVGQILEISYLRT